MRPVAWSGVFTALATPYATSGKIDWGQLRELVARVSSCSTR